MHIRTNIHAGRDIIAALLLAALGFQFGCTQEKAKLAEQENSNIKSLGILYGQYRQRHRGNPPVTESAFREFIAELDAASLKSLNIANPDDLFFSPRDKSPYVVIYNGTNTAPGPAGDPVIVYEQNGIEGKRWVANSLGAVEEVDEAKFREYVPEG